MERRLTTILAADLVGWSRLAAADEEGVIDRLRAVRRELIDPAIASQGGRIIKVMGDGLLAEFASPVAAVRAALEVQRAMPGREDGIDADRRLRFRVGVHLGDVVIDGDDLLGDGVNVAARLEGLAPPGGICVSRAVHDQLRGKIDAPLTSLGPQEVKNIPEPVEVWRAEVEGAAPAPAAPKGRDRPSIVVLPFDNMSSDPDQDFLADGIVEDVTTELSRFRWLFVIARNSAFAYKGSPKDVREIARELGVRYVLEGSVRRGGDRLRLTAQLIDAETGGHVAAQRFDRPISDLFELQDDLTAAVVAAVAPEIGAHERALARKKPPESLTAWELYQRALGEYHGYDDGAFAAARALALRAVEADATMAGPCALLARIHGAEIMGGRAPDPEAAMRAARGWAERAVTCDPRSDEAQFALSFIAAIEGRDREALEIQRRGVTLNPNNADVRMHLAVLLMWAGPAHLAAALENAEAAMRLSPADPFLWMFRTVAAMARVRLGDVSAGAALADEVRGYAGLDWKPFLFSALCEAAEGRDDRAKALVAEALERPGSASLAGLDRIFRGGDDLPGFAAASRKLVEFGLPER